MFIAIFAIQGSRAMQAGTSKKYSFDVRSLKGKKLEGKLEELGHEKRDFGI